MRMVRWMVVAVMAVGLRAGAQTGGVAGGVFGGVGPGPQEIQNGPTGSVTGVVIAQDTQRPVRFTQVQLQRVPAESAGGSVGSGAGNGQGRPGGFGGGSVSVRTDGDGRFLATHVAVGDYYATATAPGYVSERALLQAQLAAGADATALAASLPVVRVTADGSSNVTITLQRGGVISGHVEWEDGSPASGVSMNAMSTTALPTSAAMAALPASLRGYVVFGGGGLFASTDDRGNFRVAALPTGEYVLTATVQATTQLGGIGFMQSYTSPVRVYAPGVFRKAEAKAISVRAGDERTDARMVIDLRGLHAVSGHANSSNPGEAVATGRVSLTDANDSSLQIQGQIDAEGGFRLRYVPPGTYTLQITGANSVAPTGFRGGRDNGGQQTKGVAFQGFSTTVTVGDTDVTGVAVSLVPVPTQK